MLADAASASRVCWPCINKFASKHVLVGHAIVHTDICHSCVAAEDLLCMYADRPKLEDNIASLSDGCTLAQNRLCPAMTGNKQC